MDPLGAGGMGEVYRARDTTLGRDVAIKILPASLASDPERVRRFEQEARAASALNHPNIVTIHGVGRDSGIFYIVTELIEGETLRQRLNRSPIALSETLDIALQIAEALMAAHSARIVHRDIKPGNIMLRPDGIVKVLDFGLAKLLSPARAETGSDATTETATLKGTLPYMSPEQARGLSLDVRSDIFSCGVVLYEMLTGCAPFTGATPADVIAAVLDTEPVPPSRLAPAVPRELDGIVAKATAKDRRARYPHAGALLEELKDVKRALERPALQSTAASQAAPAASPELRQPPGAIRVSVVVRRASLPMALVLAVVAGISWGIFGPGRSALHAPSPAARYLYDAGSNALREGSYYQASRALEQAVEIDDRFALAHARLGEAWMELDYTDRGKDALLRVAALVADRSALPEAERLYVQAITASATRDLGAAISSYRDILQRIPDAEKAHVYVDLGRAYEKADQVDQAIENYLKAAGHDPRHAAAFLRVGILYGRQQKLEAAAGAFDKAESFYQTLSNVEGISEVVYQRGALLNSVGAPGARPQLERALELTRAIDNPHQRIKILLQLGTVCYREGKTAQAQAYAEEATGVAQREGLEGLTTEGLVSLGTALLFRREYVEAEEYFKRALDLAVRARRKHNESMARLSLGRLYVQRERDFDEGLKHLDAALDHFCEGGYRKEISDALVLRARARLGKGDYAAALEELAAQLRSALEVNDQSQVARLHALMGRAQADREAYGEALPHFQASFRVAGSIGDVLTAAYALLDQSDMLWRLGRYDEALAALDDVPSTARNLDSSYRGLLSARCALVRAEMALSQRRFAEAISQARKALELSGAEYRRTTAEAKHTLGLAQTLSGAGALGRRACLEAVTLAREKTDPRLLSNATLALSEGLVETGEAQKALETALAARERFTRAGQHDSEWRAWMIAGRASRALRDRAGARSHFAKAVQALASLEKAWGPETFRRYAARPDVRHYRRQLGTTTTNNSGQEAR